MVHIDKFIGRVDASTKARSKEVRLSLTEAQQLCFEISKLVLKENQLLEKITNLQVGKTEDGANPFENLKIDTAVDGGSFKS